jgi:hypothetical protein
MAANQLIVLGYTGVRKYRDGKDDSVAAGLPLQTTTPATGARE